MKNRNLLRKASFVIMIAICLFSSLCLPGYETGLTSGKTMAAVQSWAAGQKVEVFWKGQWYPATVLALDGEKIRVHYDGYGSEWDQSVGPRHVRRPTTAANTANAA